MCTIVRFLGSCYLTCWYLESFRGRMEASLGFVSNGAVIVGWMFQGSPKNLATRVECKQRAREEHGQEWMPLLSSNAKKS